MSDSLRPHGLQHARPPCPSPTPGVYSNSCPLSWWCYPTISSSVVSFKEIQPIHPKGNHSWIFIGRTDVEAETPNTLATWCEELTHLKDPDAGKAGGVGDDRGWDGWTESRTWWTLVWVGLGSWWWSGKPGVLQSMGSQRVGQDWLTEWNWTWKRNIFFYWEYKRNRQLYIVTLLV